jgi:beta-glucanase (GH16 family)
MNQPLLSRSVIFLPAFWLALTLACVAVQAEPPHGYFLAWSDEFEGTELDTTRWVYRTDSKHGSTQKADNVSLADGRLRLAVRKEPAGDKDYTGAGVISAQAFQYGYYEARFKVPPGAGWHTSFWMMKHDGSGGTNPPATAQELDVCENDSLRLTRYQVNVHQWNPPPRVGWGHKRIATPDLSQDFHVWGCEFTPTTARFSFGGKWVQTVDVSRFAHSGQHIWLTVIASHLGGNKAVDDSRLPAAAQFDYVRFYEKQ